MVNTSYELMYIKTLSLDISERHLKSDKIKLSIKLLLHQQPAL